jgi:hypothetical protein
MLIGCGGGATGSETASDAYVWPATYTCTHFIDTVTGADTNSGLSPEQAWASAGRAAAHTRSASARPGDTLCFKRGQRFEMTVSGQLGASGTAAAPVVIGAYGDPSLPAPRLSPSIRIDNQPDWVSLGNDVYYWPNSGRNWLVSGLWRKGVWQRPATDKFLRDGDWYYEKDGGVYLRTPGAPTASGHIYLNIRYAVFGVHGLQYIAFRDLTFEYSGPAITGRPTTKGHPPRAIGYLSVRNCQFLHMTNGVFLMSETVDGVAYENHHIDIQGNLFDDIRFGVTMGAMGNGPERHHHVLIAGNTLRNVALDGRYVVHGVMQDIEAIRMQNPHDTRIVDNRIERGLRLDQGLTSADGDVLVSGGISLYRHPRATMERLRVERNYVNDLAWGIVLGSGVESGMREVTVANNIVSNCAIGLKVNGTGTAQSYRVRFNTLFRNGTNLHIVSPGGLTVVNNFSIGPREYHVVISGANKGSTLDHNIYVPDGHFLLKNRTDPKRSRQFKNLRAFKANRAYKNDAHSIAAGDAGFVNANPRVPEDFRITDASPARGRGLATGLEDGDFGGRARAVGSGVDAGAWARHPGDD